MKTYLSVVIPAYNEAKRISATLLDIDKYLSKQKYPPASPAGLHGGQGNYEIIVVSDGSKDNTVQVVKKLQELVKNLKIIDNKKNHGKGYVVKQGMLEAKGEYRLFMDADNSTTIDHLEKFWPYLGKGRDVVIGSRAIKGAKLAVPQAWYKGLAGKLGNIFIQLIVVWGIKDTQCGFKAFSQKSAKVIFKKTTINGWGFDVEVLALARVLKYKIEEVPITWKNDPYSHVKLKSYLQVLWQTLKIKWNLITNKYKI